MPRRAPAARSPLTLWLLLLGVALTAMGLAVLWWAGRVQELPAPLPPDQRSDPRRLAALARVLLWSLLILLLFVVGATLMIRVGRVFRRPPGPRRTRYVDAWALHRLSDEQIDALTRENEGPPPAGRADP